MIPLALLYMYTCASVQAHMCVFGCEDQRLVSGVFLYGPPYRLKQGLSLEPSTHLTELV